MPPRTPFVDMNPDRLRWADLTTVPNKILGQFEAEAGYTAVPTDLKFRTVRKGGKHAVELHPDFKVVVRPQGEVWKDANKTAALLAHEELHYYVGYVVARALINDILALRASSAGQLEGALTTMMDTHLVTRGEVIQKAYDGNTGNSASTAKQHQWQKAMTDCIANPKATKLMGYEL